MAAMPDVGTNSHASTSQNANFGAFKILSQNEICCCTTSNFLYVILEYTEMATKRNSTQWLSLAIETKRYG